MKMMLVILRDDDSEIVSQALINEDYRVTRIASTGGFFRKGSSTLMIGLADERVNAAIELIRQNCSSSIEPGLKRATIFVLKVAHFERI